MFKKNKFYCIILALVILVSAVNPYDGNIVIASEKQNAWFPLKRLCVTQTAGTGSHGASTNSRNAVDFAYRSSTDSAYAFAPFDGKIVRKDSNQHAVWFQSNKPVVFADGTVDYMTVLFLHGSNFNSLDIGQQFCQGDDFYEVGGWGTTAKSYAKHFHIETIQGIVSKSGYWPRGNKNVWDSFYINTNMTTNRDKPIYSWKTLNDNERETQIESNIYVSDEKYPSGNLNLGQSFGLRGMIYSAKTLNNVTGIIIDSAENIVQPCGYNPDSKQVDLSGKINNTLIFDNLPTGSYRYVVTATDISGYAKTLIDSPFTVGSIPQPTMSTIPYVGGVRVELNTSQGVVRYTTDGSDPNASSAVYVGSINLNASTTIKAVSEDGGSVSNVISQCVTVPKIATPQISSYMETDGLKVTLTADQGAIIHYTTDGTTPTQSSPQYTSELTFKDDVTVKAIAQKTGCVDSDSASKTFLIGTPDMPVIKADGADTIAQGDAVKVRWEKQENVYSYTVKLMKDNTVCEEKEVRGNSCAFTLDEAGDYTVTVKANNFKGSSAESYPPLTLSAKAPLTVTFTDYNGSAISSQTVKYGYRAEIPINPARRGYDFSQWDNRDVYAAIKEDVTAKAVYTKKKYIVKFVNEDGSTYASQQEVPFEESVVLPEDPTINKTGYAFMGWRCTSTDNESLLDYTKVDAPMTLQAVFDWGNKDLPVITKITKANQVDANSYSVDLALTSWPQSKVYCRVLVVLKTSTGKMVKAITQDVTLDADRTTAVKNIELISDDVATQVEVNVVSLEGQKTGGVYAKAVTARTTSYSNTKWSDWSTEKPANGTESETKTMYRYRDMQYTTSFADMLSGWEQYNTDTNYGDWSSTTYSTTNDPGSSDTIQVTGTSTIYHWHHYCNYYGGRWQVDSIAYGSKCTYHSTSTNWMMPALNMRDQGNQQAYGGKGTGAPACSYNFYAWWLDGTSTTYYYRTRGKSYTYYYRKWGDWSTYSDTQYIASATRDVQSQIYYRYKINLETPTDGENNEGKIYMEKGKLSETTLNLAGKHASILVYKSTNNDPTENQLEYVGQTVIGEGNAYDFSFVPKEEPDEADSNYIVALAIEGQTALYNVDVISRSRHTYKVVFFGRNGEELASDNVEEGGSTIAPKAPEVEGYTFVGWDKETTNIQADRVLTAVYQPTEYTVAYVDWENDNIELLTLKYGTELPELPVKDVDGRKFLGWDKLLEGTKTVTESTVLSATYETSEYTVTFVDGEGKEISKQTVAHGGSAAPPTAPVVGKGQKFVSWSMDSPWWRVTRDMIVSPVILYTDSAAAPAYSMDNWYFGGLLTLSANEGEQIRYKVEYANGEEYVTEDSRVAESSADSGAEGAYDSADTAASDSAGNGSTDGTDDPSGAGQWYLYNGEILLANEAKVSFYATGENKNNSETVVYEYEPKDVENPYIQAVKLSISQVTAKAGETVDIPVSIISNPGIMGIGMTVHFADDRFHNISIERGDLIKEDVFDYSEPDENGDVFLFWSGKENITETGELFTIHLTLEEDLMDGEYPFTITYDREDCYNDNWTDVRMEIPECIIQIGSYELGDINGDGNVNNKDVVYLARYLVNRESMSTKQKSVADVNGDGSINNKDVSMLARYLVGKEDKLGKQ